MIDTKWDLRFIDLAKHISTWSKDPSTQIGSIIVHSTSRQILSMGYNGFPRSIPDCPQWLDNRPMKNDLMVHGEQNAIYNALSNGVSLKYSTIYVHGLEICKECAKAVLQVGIQRVVIHKIKETPERWAESCATAKSWLEMAGIVYDVYREGEA